MDFLFDLALQAGESWSWKGHPPLRRHIEDVVWSDVFEHALVVDRATAKIAGYVSIHSVNLFHGVGYLSVYLERTMRSRGYSENHCPILKSSAQPKLDPVTTLLFKVLFLGAL